MRGIVTASLLLLLVPDLTGGCIKPVWQILDPMGIRIPQRFETGTNPSFCFVIIFSIDFNISGVQVGPLVRFGRIALSPMLDTNGNFKSYMSIALGYLTPELAKAGTRLEVEILGVKRAAEVVSMPLYDAKNEKMKS